MTRKINSMVFPIDGRYFVGGRLVEPRSDNEYTSFNPATGEALARLKCAGKDDTHFAIQSAKEAYENSAWRSMTNRDRAEILRRIAACISWRSNTLGTIESLDTGKLCSLTTRHDVARAAENFSFYADALTQITNEAFFDKPLSAGKEISMMSVVKREPLGVIGIIVPWNSPLMLASWHVAPALAMGNTVALKPSPWAALSCLRLGKIAKDAGLPDGVLNVIVGEEEAGRALIAHPDIAKISFTGSAATGHAVNIQNAHARLIPPLLELGGKAPNVVFRDADIDSAVRGVAFSIFRSQGQSCVAGSRLLIEDSIYEVFLDRLVEFTRALKIGDPFRAETDIGPLITSEHASRVMGYITSALSEGARLRTGGHRVRINALPRGNFVEPTIFSEVTREMRIWKEEVFGPVLAAAPFHTIDDAIMLANDTRFGLSANIWTKDISKALRTAAGIRAGMVWINSHFLRDLRTPFGGVKESGWGSAGGRYALEAYSEPKMICIPH